MAFSHARNVDASDSFFQEIHGDQYNVVSILQRGTQGAMTEGDLLREDIYQWLSAPDPSWNHNDACEKRQDSTGTWFVEGKRFADWKNDPNSFIWLYGIPGSGKTVLCSNIIQEVSSHCSDDPSLAFAYFYFDFNDERKQLVRNLVSSLVTQFSSSCTSIPDGLATLYSNSQEGRQQPPTASLIKTLRDILTSFRHAYIVLDALDECAEQDKLLSFIGEITDWKLGKSHILATSRPDRVINDHLTARVSDAIDLQRALVDVDIRVHVRECLQNDFRLSKWPAEIKEGIEMSLMEDANGMFRWVACQLEVLRKCLKVDMIKKALKSLPKSLDETYDRILLNIDEMHSEDAHKVLQWLAFSARPVTMAEVAHVLAINVDEGVLLSPDQQLFNPHYILDICSSLITTSSSTMKSDKTQVEDEDILKLAHFSVKEYLVSQRIQVGTVAQYSLIKKLADTFISHTCLIYLLQFNKMDSLDPNTTSHFPLAQYAAEYWIHHAHSDDGVIHNVLENSIRNLLEPHGPRLVNWVWLYDIDDPCESPILSLSLKSIAPALYYASVGGLEKASLWLIEDMGVEVNAQGGRYGNALQVASLKDHKVIVQLLLEKGADINAQEGEYGNALQAASSAGHQVIVQLLLEKGADINAQGGRYGNALQAASSRGHEVVVQLLLEKGADINARGGPYGNALQVASLKGHEVIVVLLLEKGADINVQGGEYGNALQAASSAGHEMIVQLLLQKGANINAQGGEYGNALQAASLGGHEVIVQLLLKNGADINAQGETYWDALQAASLRGHEVIVELLLEKGADINIQRGWYGNALQAASSGGHEVIVQLLLEKGANINAQGGQYGNALQAASSRGYKAIVQLLLEKDADINVQGETYGNALQIASLRGHEVIVQLLLEKGADINAQGGEYGNALQAAASAGHEMIVQLLLEKGADINAQGGQYGNALQAASLGDHQMIVQLLLQKGADINAQGGEYGNALQAASLGGHKVIIELLLEKGANINAQGGEYGNALQAASLGGHEVIVLLLLENGADINAQGGEYGNALQAATLGGHEMIVQLLLEIQCGTGTG